MGTRTYIIFTSDGVAHGTKMEWHTEQSDIEDTVAQMVAGIGKKLWHTLPTYGKQTLHEHVEADLRTFFLIELDLDPG